MRIVQLTTRYRVQPFGSTTMHKVVSADVRTACGHRKVHECIRICTSLVIRYPHTCNTTQRKCT